MQLIFPFKCFLLLVLLKIDKVQSQSSPDTGPQLKCYVGQKIQYWNEEWVENLMSIKCGLSYCSNMTITHTNRNESSKVVIEYSCGTDTLNLCENITNGCLNGGIDKVKTCCCNTDLCNHSNFSTFSLSLSFLLILYITIFIA